MMSGGNFWQGFASGALSSLASSLYGGSGFKNAEGNFIQQTRGLNGIIGGGDFGTIAFGTVIGGAGAELSGGNFWQGAATGLIVSGLNHVMHSIGGDGDPPTKSNLEKIELRNSDGLTLEEYNNLPLVERLLSNRPDVIGGAVEFGPGKGAKYLMKMLARDGTSLVEVKKIGDFWKYTTKTMAKNGNGSYTLTSKYLNAQGKTIKWFHDTYAKTGTFLHRGFTEGSTKVHLWWNGVKQYGDDFFQTYR